jgi:hypothetical protein
LFRHPLSLLLPEEDKLTGPNYIPSLSCPCILVAIEVGGENCRGIHPPGHVQRAVLGEVLHGLERVPRAAAMGAGVHEDGAAHGARDARCPLQPTPASSHRVPPQPVERRARAHADQHVACQTNSGLKGPTVLEQRSRTLTGPKHVFVKWARSWGSKCHEFNNSLSELADMRLD